MSDDIASHIIRSLRHKTGFPGDNIKLKSELLSDLGLDGDDAAEFFDDLARHFGTDLSPLQQEWHRHFRAEPTIVSIFRKPPSKLSLQPITVENVVLAVERGSW